MFEDETQRSKQGMHTHMKIPGITLTMPLMTVNIGNLMLTIHLPVPLYLTLKVPNLSMSLCLQTLRPNCTSPGANTHLQYASPIMSTQPQFLSPLSSAQAQLTNSACTKFSRCHRKCFAKGIAYLPEA